MNAAQRPPTGLDTRSGLEATGLVKRYGTRTVVDGGHLRVCPGEVVGLLGPNGAGKTTTFYMVVGLVRADAGTILIDGQAVQDRPIHQRSRLGLSYLPQEASIFRRLNVEDNIRAVLELQRGADGKPLSEDDIERRLDSLLAVGRYAVMMLAGPDLRVVPMTTHIPLASVAAQLDVRLIRRRIRATAKGLMRDFGISNPRLAVAGFNPHAGESGNLGREEIDIFAPALKTITEEGYDVIGPLPADTMFHAEARQNFDAALCAYHDQALIPLKTLYFHEAVNITLGLPVVRTSPDHGTAFGIAGNGEARADSMIAAIRMAGEAVANRKAYAAACAA